MSSRSSKSKSPSLNYYPSSLNSPCYDSCGSGSGNSAVIAASVILVILIVFVVIGGIWYWSSPGCSGCGSSGSCGCGSSFGESKKKVVRFAESLKGGQPKELQECSKELLDQIMNGKTDPCVIAFVAPWCGFCTQMKPALEAAAKEANVPIYTLTQKDGNEHVGAAAKHLKVPGFPALFLVENGKATAYQGDRSQQSIIEFAK